MYHLIVKLKEIRVHLLVREEFLDKSTALGIFRHDLQEKKELAFNVGNSWITFSKFIPDFFSQIVEEIENVTIKERINHIIAEELGNDNQDLSSHSELYRQSLATIGIIVDQKELKSIQFLQEQFILKEHKDRESFAVGVCFGLEIIAEQNIDYLLKYSCVSSEDINSLRKTLFFKIHLVNEIEHINKCFENYHLVARDTNSHRSFHEGCNLSLEFWKFFWDEATYVQ